MTGTLRPLESYAKAVGTVPAPMGFEAGSFSEAMEFAYARADELNFPLEVLWQGTVTVAYPRALRERGYR